MVEDYTGLAGCLSIQEEVYGIKTKTHLSHEATKLTKQGGQMVQTSVSFVPSCETDLKVLILLYWSEAKPR
jgi:hypothetical protein